MAKKIYGFYTGQLEIPPYLNWYDISEDCLCGLVDGAWRRHDNGKYIIPADQVEAYYRSKNLPQDIIAAKMIELKRVGYSSKKFEAGSFLSLRQESSQLTLLTS